MVDGVESPIDGAILSAIDVSEISNLPLRAVGDRLSEYGVTPRRPRQLWEAHWTRAPKTTEGDDPEVARIGTLSLEVVLQELGVDDVAARVEGVKEYIRWLGEGASNRSIEYTSADKTWTTECAEGRGLTPSALLQPEIGCSNRLIADLQNVAEPDLGLRTEQVMALASPLSIPASQNNVHKLAGQFYEAARTGDGWEAALGNTAEELGANTAIIIVSDKNTNAPTEFMIGGNLDGDVMALYAERYGGIDPASAVVRSLPVGLVESCHHYVKTGFVRKSPYYQEFLIPQGGRYSSGARLFEDEREWGRIGFQTNEKQGPIDGRRFETLQELTPHIQLAMQQYRMMRSMRTAAHMGGMLDAFQQMGRGAVVIESNCAIVQMNDAARRHLGRGVNGFIGGLLAPTDRGSWPAFRQMAAAVARMTRASARECSLPLERREGRPLIARMSPAFEPGGASRSEALVLVQLVDMDERANVVSECLREAFGLTKAEARVAAALAGGKTLKEAATKLGVADGTVRGQIKSIFAKTETRGQPELAALLERLAVADKK